MFSEEKCPYCDSGDYEVQNYEEGSWDDGIFREWDCQCSNCKFHFTITYYYELIKVEVSAS